MEMPQNFQELQKLIILRFSKGQFFDFWQQVDLLLIGEGQISNIY